MNQSIRGRCLTSAATLLAVIVAVHRACGEETAAAQPLTSSTKYWYDVLVSSPFESSGFREYIGASPLAEADMAKALLGGSPVALSDRRAFDPKTGAWAEYARLKPLLTDREYLNPAHILAIYPLVGDPLVARPPAAEESHDSKPIARVVEPASAPGKHWYDVVVAGKVEAKGVREFVGSSRLAESVLARQMFSDAPLMLDDLRFYHLQTGRWSDWAGTRFPMTNRVYLNPKHILSIAPFTGDPLVSNSTLPIDRDLGTCDWRDAPKRWKLQLPAEVTKVQVTFYSEGGEVASADAGLGGVLQVNAEMAVGFRSEEAGHRTFHDYLKKADYQTNGEAAGLFIDVTPLIKPGENEFLYYHRSPKPMGVNLRIFGTEFREIIKQLGGVIGPDRYRSGGLSIDLNDTKITDADLACLDGQGQVTELMLRRTKIGDAGLRHVSGLTGLRELGLGGTKITDGGLRSLAGLSRLRRIDLFNTAVSDEALTALSGLQELEELVIHQTRVTGPGLAHLRGLPKLARLYWTSCDVGDDGLAQAAELRGLQILGVDGPRITEAGIAHLARLGQLQDLSLSGTSAGDSAMAHLKTLSDLRALHLANTQITDVGLREIAALRGLITLILSGTKVTDAGLEHVQGLSQLRILNLANTGVTDAGLARLAPLEQLRALYLDGTSLDGSGLVHLNKMQRLELLVLERTPLTDAALAHLSPLKSLRRLLVRGTAINDQAIDALKKQLPELNVIK